MTPKGIIKTAWSMLMQEEYDFSEALRILDAATKDLLSAEFKRKVKMEQMHFY